MSVKKKRDTWAVFFSPLDAKLKIQLQTRRGRGWGTIRKVGGERGRFEIS